MSRIYKGMPAIVVASILAMYGAKFVPDTWIYASKFRDANDVICRVEAFRRIQGRLPATLSEIGRTDDERGPLFYNVWSDHRYILSFTAPQIWVLRNCGLRLDNENVARRGLIRGHRLTCRCSRRAARQG